jgi:ParB-like chromosome segregation protein Spo0J
MSGGISVTVQSVINALSDLRAPPEADLGYLESDKIRTSFAHLRPGRIGCPVDHLSDLPIRVVVVDDGSHFEVIDGFKRLAGWRANGFTQIPVVFEQPCIPLLQKRLLLEANSPSRTVSPLDEGRVVESLIHDDKLTSKAVGHLLGRKPGWVSARLALATKLSPRAAEKVASRDLGPTLAHFLTALSHNDQDAVLATISHHGLNTRESTMLIQAFRVADATDRRTLLKDPLATVRPETSPIASPQLAQLEQLLDGVSKALAELRELKVSPDLSGAERRRIEALHRRVCREVIETARQFETDVPAAISNNKCLPRSLGTKAGSENAVKVTSSARDDPSPARCQADVPSP